MAEAVGVVASTVALIDVSFKLLRVSAYLYQEEFSTLYRTYGRYVAFLMSVFFKNTASEYARIEDVVLQGDDREALLFRDSVATECNMTAVAVGVPLVSEDVPDAHAGCHYRPGRSHSALVAKFEPSTLDGSGFPTICDCRRLPFCLLCLQIAKDDWQIVPPRNGPRLA